MLQAVTGATIRAATTGRASTPAVSPHATVPTGSLAGYAREHQQVDSKRNIQRFSLVSCFTGNVSIYNILLHTNNIYAKHVIIVIFHLYFENTLFLDQTKYASFTTYPEMVGEI